MDDANCTHTMQTGGHSFLQLLILNVCESRSSHRRCSVKKDALKNFAIFTGKHLSWGLFLIKLQALTAASVSRLFSDKSKILLVRFGLCDSFFLVFQRREDQIDNVDSWFDVYHEKWRLEMLVVFSPILW